MFCFFFFFSSSLSCYLPLSPSDSFDFVNVLAFGSSARQFERCYLTLSIKRPPKCTRKHISNNLMHYFHCHCYCNIVAKTLQIVHGLNQFSKKHSVKMSCFLNENNPIFICQHWLLFNRIFIWMTLLSLSSCPLNFGHIATLASNCLNV